MFRHDGAPRLGIVREGGNAVVDVAASAPGLTFTCVRDVIDAGSDALGRLRDVVESNGVTVRGLEGIEVLAPLDPPRGNVICVGRNYERHAEESARATDAPKGPPTVFTKALTTINAPFGEVPIDESVSDRIDWEVELGVVIGREGRTVPRARALEHVFGYTVVNDVTARDVQYGWGGQWFKGKSLDGSCPIGPWVVTADEVEDVNSLQLTLRVNGVVKQGANTRDMIHPVDSLIEWLSVGMTLQPGMLIATGTPDGVGHARTPPEFLRPGDVMESEVSGIGVLRNRIVHHDEWRRP